MSFAATRWAWSLSLKSVGQRAVLMNLADRANVQGQCWPSQARIASDTGLCIRSVRTRLAELEALGYISRQKRNNTHGRRTDLITLRIGGKPTPAAVQATPPPPAPDAATKVHDLPEGTGTDCRQTNQDSTHQIKPNSSIGTPIWLELIPQLGRSDIDRHNRAAAFAAEAAPSIASADWNSPGLENLKLIEDWLDRFDVPVLRDCLIETAARAARAGTRIVSWQYFAKEIDRLSHKNG